MRSIIKTIPSDTKKKTILWEEKWIWTIVRLSRLWLLYKIHRIFSSLFVHDSSLMINITKFNCVYVGLMPDGCQSMSSMNICIFVVWWCCLPLPFDLLRAVSCELAVRQFDLRSLELFHRTGWLKSNSNNDDRKRVRRLCYYENYFTNKTIDFRLGITIRIFYWFSPSSASRYLLSITQGTILCL